MMEGAAEVLDAVKGLRPNPRGRVYTYCPLCLERKGSPDKKRALRFDFDIGFFRCYRCGAWGYTQERGESRAPSAPAPLIDAPEVELPDGFRSFRDIDDPTSFSARHFVTPLRYLAGRGVSFEIASDIGMGFCLHGKYAQRVVIPVYDGERLVGWSARDITGKAIRKYENAPGMVRDRMLFNMNAILVKTTQPLICAEGGFDALAYWPDAVCFLGKPSPGQLPIIMKARRPLAVVLDGDAWREGWAYARRLQLRGLKAGSIRLPPKKDPNTVDVQWLQSAAQALFKGPAAP